MEGLLNKKILTYYLILIIAPLFFGCSGPVKEENKNSVVTWTGSSVHGKHEGYVYISKGELMIENGQLMGGAVEVDMNTLETEKHRRKDGLINHLKSPDFFDVNKFPFSTITITRVA